MRTFFNEFCEHSTIHGVRYFTERNRHWTERLFWVIAFSILILFCASSIGNIWIKWCDNPVVMSFTERKRSISDVPFPTVTVCPQTKFYKKYLDAGHAYQKYSSMEDKMSTIEKLRFESMLHICSNPLSFEMPSSKNEFTNRSIYEVIKNVAPFLNSTMFACQWREKWIPCDELFTNVLTEDGSCFQFNGINSYEKYTANMTPEMMTLNTSPDITNWSLENGYTHEMNDGFRDYPERTSNAKAALIVVLQLSMDDFDYYCAGHIQGFKIILTLPGEARKVSVRHFKATMSEQSDILIKPKMIVTSEKLRRYKPSVRQCFYNSERQLHFFKFYTQNNCEAECLANFTKRECGCVKFSMPRNKHTKICGMAKIDCYKNAEIKLFGGGVNDDSRNDSIKVFRARCNCLASCNIIRYDAEIDRTKFEWAHLQNNFNLLTKNESDTRMSVLSVLFADHQLDTYLRTASSTYTQFFGISGGLLGLCLGVSLLSVIEFIYFFTLRLFWTIRFSKIKNTVAPFQRKTVINSISIESI